MIFFSIVVLLKEGIMKKMYINQKDRIFLLIMLFLFLFCISGDAAPHESLNLSFLGDIMAHEVNFRIKKFAVVYEHIKRFLLADDLTFSNLEAPVDEKLPYKPYPRFNVHSDYVQAVIDAGIEVFPLANNHSLDQNVDGIYRTLGSMMILRDDTEMNIHFSGTRGNIHREFVPVEIRKNGWRIGFISVTHFLNGYVRSPNVYIVNFYNKKEADTFAAFVENVADNYDLFIISFHAGGEYLLDPEEEKIMYFRRLIHAGADIIYGHHPHVLQPYEIIESQGCKKLILYSMGNFISGQRWSSVPYDLSHYRSNTGDSLILTAEIEHTGSGPSVKDMTIIPITNHINEKKEIVVMTYEQVLALDLKPEWKTYYEGRYSILQKRIASYGKID